MPTVVRQMYHEPPRTAPKLRPDFSTPYTSSPVNTKLMSAIMAGASRELPMPIVSRISGLPQAYGTLQNCSYRLSRRWAGAPVNRPSPIGPEERRQFQRWLEQWEQAFTAYLSQTMPNMKTEDITRCRVLKANHLACTILASDGMADAFENDFGAIVELADAVLQTRAQSSPMSPSPGMDIPGATALDVYEPLQVVASRCRRSSVRNRAVEMLGAMSPR